MMGMELRHTKVDVMTEILQKGCRIPSSVSRGRLVNSDTRNSSAESLGDEICIRPKTSNPAFQSAKSRHFEEIELTDPNKTYCHNKNVPNHNRQTIVNVQSERNVSSPNFCYDNLALVDDENLDSNKNVYRKNAIETFLRQNAHDTDTFNIANGQFDDRQQARYVEESRIANFLKSVQTRERVAKPTLILTNEQNSTVETTGLKRSETTETYCSIEDHGTLSTVDSVNSLNSSWGKDSTLLLRGSNTSANTLSESSTTENSVPIRPPEVPPVVILTDKSLKTYRKVKNDGIRAGRCIIFSTAFLTFSLTMVLAILLLLMGGSSVQNNVTRDSCSGREFCSNLTTKEELKLSPVDGIKLTNNISRDIE